MNLSYDQRRLLALCAIRVDNKSIDWSLIARLAQSSADLDELYSGKVSEQSDAAAAARQLLRRGLEDMSTVEETVEANLVSAKRLGAKLTTVLDDDYPSNLRLIYNLPPFLFYRGTLSPDDARSVAVVGTRKASQRGLDHAQRMAERLVEQGVVVTSGLAAGIDSAAHRATLAVGGRTIAVLGTGLENCYPAENRDLLEEIATSGLVISQFWTYTRPAKWTFPRRNVVTSGLSQGTVVIEASKTSGAKMQARLALEHGKRVFLIKSLVAQEDWAQSYVAKRGAIEVEKVDDVIRHLADATRVAAAGEQRRQTQLALL